MSAPRAAPTFLTLPGEIRNMIYDLVLRSQTAYLLSRWNYAVPTTKVIKDACQPYPHHPLAFVNRQIRSEVITLPSSEDVVTDIKSYVLPDSELEDWIKSTYPACNGASPRCWDVVHSFQGDPGKREHLLESMTSEELEYFTSHASSTLLLHRWGPDTRPYSFSIKRGQRCGSCGKEDMLCEYGCPECITGGLRQLLDYHLATTMALLGEDQCPHWWLTRWNSKTNEIRWFHNIAKGIYE